MADLRAALARVPRWRDWLRTAVELAWALPVIVAVGWAGGLMRLQAPPDAAAALGLALTLLLVPALGEELLFRGLLIPRHRPARRWLVLSVLLFVLWHPLQAVTIGPSWSAAFLDPWFLAAVAVLGAALARIYAATGSIWPPVLGHWLVVFLWKTVGGGLF